MTDRTSKNDLYRKKPVVITAWQVPDDKYDVLDRAPAWVTEYRGETYEHPTGRKIRGKVLVQPNPFDAGWFLWIPTLEGSHVASKGDWIIRGVKGEIYPCRPDIFAETYEPAASPPETTAPPTDTIIAELHALLQEAVTLAELGDIDETTEAYGWGAWLKQARSAVKSEARHLTQPERDALNRAADASGTEVTE